MQLQSPLFVVTANCKRVFPTAHHHPVTAFFLLLGLLVIQSRKSQLIGSLSPVPVMWVCVIKHDFMGEYKNHGLCAVLMPVMMGDGRRRGQKVDLHFKDILQDINNKTRRVVGQSHGTKKEPLGLKVGW